MCALRCSPRQGGDEPRNADGVAFRQVQRAWRGGMKASARSGGDGVCVRANHVPFSPARFLAEITAFAGQAVLAKTLHHEPRYVGVGVIWGGGGGLVPHRPRRPSVLRSLACGNLHRYKIRQEHTRQRRRRQGQKTKTQSEGRRGTQRTKVINRRAQRVRRQSKGG